MRQIQRQPNNWYLHVLMVLIAAVVALMCAGVMGFLTEGVRGANEHGNDAVPTLADFISKAERALASEDTAGLQTLVRQTPFHVHRAVRHLLDRTLIARKNEKAEEANAWLSAASRITKAAIKEAGELRGQSAMDLYESWNAEQQSRRVQVLSLLDEARRGIETSQFSQALELVQEAIDHSRELGDSFAQAQCLNAGSFAYRSMGRWEDLREASVSALALFEEWGDATGQSRALSGIAHDLRRTDSKRSVEEFLRAADLARNAGARRAEAEALGGLGLVYWNPLGLYQDALDTLAKAAGLAGNSGSRFEEAIFLLNMGQVYGVLANYSESEQHLEKSQAIASEIGDRSGEAWVLWALGNVRRNLADYDGAQDAYVEAAFVAREVNDRVVEGLALNGVGNVKLNRADYTGALEVFQEALTLAELDPPSERLVATLSYNLGQVHKRLSDYDLSLKYYEKALAIARKRSDARREAMVFGEFGEIHRLRSELDDALVDLRASLEVFQKLESRWDESYAYLSLGDTYVKLEELTEAAEMYGRALEIATLLQTPEVETRALLGLGEVAMKQERFKEARRSFQRALTVASAVQDREGQWVSLYLLGKVYRAQGKTSQALENLRRSVSIVDSIRSRLALQEQETGLVRAQSDVYRELMELLLDMHDERPERGYDRQAHRYLELLLVSGARAAYVRSRPMPADPEAAEVVEAYFSADRNEVEISRALQEEKSKPETERNEEKIKNLEEQFGDSRQRFSAEAGRIRKKHPEIYARLNAQPLEFAKLQGHIPDGVVLLQPIVLPDQIVTFAVTRNALVTRQTRVPEHEVYLTIKSFRDALTRPGLSSSDSPRGVRIDAPTDSDRRDLKAIGKKIHDWVIGPVAESLEGAEIVGVAPSGKLRYIPFAALHDGSQYLMESRPLFYLNSASAIELVEGFKRIKKTGEGQNADVSHAANMKLLAFGDPDGSLPFARDEVVRLAKTFSDPQAYYGKEAKKDTFLRQSSGVPVIHLATHAVLKNDHPEGSYILFAGDSPSEQRLQWTEIPRLDLRDARLVTLSACETALGERAEGDEIAGLAMQFEIVGADATMGTLWKVDDAATAALMERFYQELKKGAGFAAALRTSQLALLKSSDKPHPYLWSAFILIGSPS